MIQRNQQFQVVALHWALNVTCHRCHHPISCFLVLLRVSISSWHIVSSSSESLIDYCKFVLMNLVDYVIALVQKTK